MSENNFFQEMRKHLTKRLQVLKGEQEERRHDEEFAQESVGELSNYDNHPADQGTELYEREKDLAFFRRDETEVEEIEKALERMDEGTYGRCEVCGQEIPRERLEALPTALRCVEHAEEEIHDNRPVEEDFLIPGKSGFTGQVEPDVEHDRLDAEETWESVERYGTSDTPSDTGEEYEDLYGSKDKERDD